MPPDRLTLAYQARVAAIQATVASRLAALYDGEIEIDAIAESFRRYIEAARPIIERGQASVGALAEAFLMSRAAVVGIALELEEVVDAVVGTTREGADIATGMDAFGPMVLGQIGSGAEPQDALDFGRYLATRYADSELTGVADRIRDDEAVRRQLTGWEGIVNPDACDGCQANRGRHDLAAEMYRHPGCNCVWEPVFGGGYENQAEPGAAAAETVPELALEETRALDPAELRAAAEDLVGAATMAEPEVTSTLESVGERVGGVLRGLEFRLKTIESTERKVAGDVADKGLSVADARAQIFDALRYTYEFAPGEYASGTTATIATLRAEGYEVVRLKNFWGGEGYAGVNGLLRAPSGHVFELQFHTAESLATKDPSHKLYEALRILAPNDPTREIIQRRIDVLWGPIQDNAPPGAAAIRAP